MQRVKKSETKGDSDSIQMLKTKDDICEIRFIIQPLHTYQSMIIDIDTQLHIVITPPLYIYIHSRTVNTNRHRRAAVKPNKK